MRFSTLRMFSSPSSATVMIFASCTSSKSERGGMHPSFTRYLICSGLPPLVAFEIAHAASCNRGKGRAVGWRMGESRTGWGRRRRKDTKCFNNQRTQHGPSHFCFERQSHQFSSVQHAPPACPNGLALCTLVYAGIKGRPED